MKFLHVIFLLEFKYKIKCSYWYKNWSYINSCISDFVSNSNNQNVFIVGCTIRELCISRILINIVLYVDVHMLLLCRLIPVLLCVFHVSFIMYCIAP